MFTAPHFQDHDKAREYLEALRWAGEPVCAHCGTIGGHYATKKAGVWRCHSKECRKDFSVTTKTVMESSHIKLHIWLQAFALLTASKKGISAHQLHRSLKITYKSAWFLCHRIREPMHFSHPDILAKCQAFPGFKKGVDARKLFDSVALECIQAIDGKTNELMYEYAVKDGPLPGK